MQTKRKAKISLLRFTTSEPTNRPLMLKKTAVNDQQNAVAKAAS
jgi:hypothetical protein